MSEDVQSYSHTPQPRRFGRDTPSHITGVGAVTGYGWGRKHIWDGFLLGESAVKLTSGFPRPRRGRQRLSGPGQVERGTAATGPSRFMQAARFAAREAITDAMERGWKPGPVVGLIHSLVLGDVEMWREFYRSDEVA